MRANNFEFILNAARRACFPVEMMSFHRSKVKVYSFKMPIDGLRCSRDKDYSFIFAFGLFFILAKTNLAVFYIELW